MNVVVLAIHFDQAGVDRVAVLDIPVLAAVVVNTGVIKDALVHAVVVEYMPFAGIEGVDLQGSGATVNHVAVLIEVIGIAVDGVEAVGVSAGAEEVAGALGQFDPDAIHQLAIFKFIGKSVVAEAAVLIGIGAVITGVVLGAEVVPLAVDGDPSIVQHACHGIVGLAIFAIEQTGIGTLADAVFTEVVINTVNSGNAGQSNAINIVAVLDPAIGHNAIDIGLTVGEYAVEQFTAGALQHAVHADIGVAGSGNSCAPVNHRITHSTESPIGVAVLGAGGLQVLQSSCCVNVVAALLGPISLIHHTVISIGLSIHADAAREIAGAVIEPGHQTHIDINTNLSVVDALILPHVCRSLAFVAGILMHTALPHAHGNACDHIAFPINLLAITGKGDQNIILCLLGSSCGPGHVEAVCHHHVVQFPLVDAVQIQQSGNGLNILNVVADHIHPVYGTGEQAVQGSIVRNQLNGSLLGAGLHHKAPHDGLGVAAVILDLEAHCVVAVCQNCIFGSDGAVCIAAADLVAINKDLCGACIQAGVIRLGGVVGNIGAEDQVVVNQGDNLTVGQVHTAAGNAVSSRIAEYRQLTVCHGIGIVHRNIIDVVGKVTVVIGKGLGVAAKDTVHLDKEVSLVGTARIAGLVMNEQIVLEFGHIDSDILPAGFFHVRRPIRCIDQFPIVVIGVLCSSLNHAIGIHIEGIHRDLSRGCILGDIQPEAYGLSALNGYGIAVPGQRQCDIAGSRTGRTRALREIGTESQGLLAAVHQAGFFVDDIDLAMLIIFNIAFMGSDDPVVRVGTGRTLFEVKNDLRSLTVSDCHRGGHIRTGKRNRQGSAGDAGLSSRSRQLQTVQRAVAFVGQSGNQVAFVIRNFADAVICVDSKINCLAVRNDDVFAAEAQAVGNHHLDFRFTHDLTAANHLDDSLTGGTVGGENAVVHSTHGAVGQLPGNILGNLSRTTGCVNADGVDLHAAAGGHKVILGSQDRMVKGTVRHSSGNQDQRVGNSALRAVGGAVNHAQSVRAFRLGAVSCRATAVQVNSFHAAHGKHDLSLLLNSQTVGAGSLVAVSSHDNDLAVGSNANSLTGIFIRIVQTGADGAIIDQMDPAANSLLDLILHGRILSLVANVSRTVLQNSEVRTIITGSIAVDLHTLHHEGTGGLTAAGVVVGSIDRDDNILSLVIFLECGCLLGGLLHAPFVVLVVLIVCKNFYRLDAHVRCGNKHFHTVAVFGTDDDLIFGDTRRQSGLIIGNDGHIIITKTAGNVRCCGICFPDVRRQQAYYHNDRKDHRKHAHFHRMLHFLTSSCVKLISITIEHCFDLFTWQPCPQALGAGSMICSPSCSANSSLLKLPKPPSGKKVSSPK